MPNSKVVHLRYARVAAASDRHEFVFAGDRFALKFASPQFDRGQGFEVEQPSADGYSYLPVELEYALNLYFGEDAIDPERGVDSRFLYTRRTFAFDARGFDRFLRAFSRWPRKSDAKWRHDLYWSALNYYTAGIRGGFAWMPFTLGYFGLALECIGNVLYGSRTQYSMLGQKRFMDLFNKRLAGAKRKLETREAAREFGKRFAADIDLLHALRNAVFGHSRLHLTKDADDLARLLELWRVRYGLSPTLAKGSARPGGLENTLISDGPALYKMGLRATRVILFMVLGYRSRVPFASHDFDLLGDIRPDERLGLGPHVSVRVSIEVPPNSALQQTAEDGRC